MPSSHLNDASLRQLFQGYGKIINTKILRDENTGQFRGTAFVRFDRREEAEAAIRNLNGKHLSGSTMPLVVKVSEEHGKQTAEALRIGSNPAAPSTQLYFPSRGQEAIRTGLIAPPEPAPPAPQVYFPSYSSGYSEQGPSRLHHGGDGLMSSVPNFVNPAYIDPAYANRSGGYPSFMSQSPQIFNPAFRSGQWSIGGNDYPEQQSRGGGPMRGGRDRDGSRIWAGDRQGGNGNRGWGRGGRRR